MPTGQRVAAACIVGDVGIVQVGERGLEIARPSAGQVGARMQPLLAMDLKANLKGEGDVGEAGNRFLASIDHHDRDGE